MLPAQVIIPSIEQYTVLTGCIIRNATGYFLPICTTQNERSRGIASEIDS